MSDTALSIREIIAHSAPFDHLPDAVLDRLAAEAEEISVAAGEAVYESGTASDDIYVLREGMVRLEPSGPASAGASSRDIRPSDAFGWTALSSSAARRERAVATMPSRLLLISGTRFIAISESVRAERTKQEVDVPAAPLATLLPEAATFRRQQNVSDSLDIFAFRVAQWFKSPTPYLLLLGYALFLGSWYLAVQVWKLPRFAQMPGLTDVVQEWTSRNPVYGVSIFTPVYYEHIFVSLRRIAVAFTCATLIGVPVGLFLGWSKTFKEYVFPLFELLRPIPPLAWVPLAIVMLPGSELPVLYLTFLASFFATALNTMLGVRSIDPTYFQAANCLGASRAQVFWHVVVPGSMPFIFTGLQISMGVAWFSLVAAEMVSGQFGLGYLINTSYTTVQYPTMVIAMLTLGIVGYASSALVRLAGNWLMSWRTRQLALDGAR
jgi:ABC-type nitrate/sulfonate/bicarbonate transport system permease component